MTNTAEATGFLVAHHDGQPVGYAIRVYSGANPAMTMWSVKSTIFGYPRETGGFSSTAYRAEATLVNLARELCEVERPKEWALELAPESYRALERELRVHEASGSRVNL